MSWLITIVVFLMIIPASILLEALVSGFVEILVCNTAQSWKAKFALAIILIFIVAGSLFILKYLHYIIGGFLK